MANVLRTGVEKFSKNPASTPTNVYLTVQNFLLVRPLFCASLLLAAAFITVCQLSLYHLSLVQNIYASPGMDEQQLANLAAKQAVAFIRQADQNNNYKVGKGVTVN
jgi:hypothetical protein